MVRNMELFMGSSGCSKPASWYYMPYWYQPTDTGQQHRGVHNVSFQRDC
jgi:hypothetical protein